EQHVPGGLKNQRDGGGLFKGQTFWIRKAIDFGAADEFGEATVNSVAEMCEVRAAVVVTGEAGGTFAAGDAWSEQDFLAGVDGRDARTHFGDAPSDVAARNVRQWNRHAGQSAAHPEIEMVQCTGAYANQHLAGSQFRFGCVRVAQHLGSAVMIEGNGLHWQLLTRSAMLVRQPQRVQSDDFDRLRRGTM